PEAALVLLDWLLARELPFQPRPPHEPSMEELAEPDTRSPSQIIEDTVEKARRQVERYSARDRGHIRKLELCGHACDAVMAHLHLCPRLQSLDLCYGEITDRGMAHLAGLKRLRVLDLDDNLITDAGLIHLAQLRRLRQLSLTGLDGITSAGLVHIAGLTRLRKLALS